MTPASQPYLQVDSIGARLDLREISAQRTIRPGSYEVRVDGAPVEIYAVEPRISTGGPPIRAVELYGLGPAAEQLLLLEAQLRGGTGRLQLKDGEGETFDITFKKLRSTLAATGTFLTEGDREEFESRIKLPGGTLLSGFGQESRWRDQRALIVGDLPQDAQLALIRAVVARAGVVVEKIS